MEEILKKDVIYDETLKELRESALDMDRPDEFRRVMNL